MPNVPYFELVSQKRHHTATYSPSAERLQYSHPFNLSLTLTQEPNPGSTNNIIVFLDDYLWCLVVQTVILNIFVDTLFLDEDRSSDLKSSFEL